MIKTQKMEKSMNKYFYQLFLKKLQFLRFWIIDIIITNNYISNINFLNLNFFLLNGKDRISVGLFLFLKFLFNFLIFLLFDKSKVKLTSFFKNLYFSEKLYKFA